MAKLTELVEERKQQAIDREIFEKVELVLKYLGKNYRHYGNIFLSYNVKELKLNRAENNRAINITYETSGIPKVVFVATHSDKIEIYLPGIWEEEVDSIIAGELGFKIKTKGEK